MASLSKSENAVHADTIDFLIKVEILAFLGENEGRF